MARRVRLSVKSVAGRCGAGYKVGDSFIVEGARVKAEEDQSICLYAFPSLTPYLAAYGRETPESDWINNLTQLQCPDARNTVLFSVERLEE